jgi:hypothetical protein
VCPDSNFPLNPPNLQSVKHSVSSPSFALASPLLLRVPQCESLPFKLFPLMFVVRSLASPRSPFLGTQPVFKTENRKIVAFKLKAKSSKFQSLSKKAKSVHLVSFFGKQGLRSGQAMAHHVVVTGAAANGGQRNARLAALACAAALLTLVVALAVNGDRKDEAGGERRRNVLFQWETVRITRTTHCFPYCRCCSSPCLFGPFLPFLSRRFDW